MSSTNYKFYFRGTTIGYPGNHHSQNLPVTCTSTNPIIALLFALECSSKNPLQAVVYIAKSEKLVEVITLPQNVLGEYEDEIPFSIKPVDFFSLCEGYVGVEDLKAALLAMGINCYYVVNNANLTMMCGQARRLNPNEILKLWELLLPNLKKM